MKLTAKTINITLSISVLAAFFDIYGSAEAFQAPLITVGGFNIVSNQTIVEL